MKVLMSGGSGFIGTRLTEYLMSNHHQVIVLTRNPKNKISPQAEVITSLSELKKDKVSETIDCVINLSGATISKRWTNSYKKELLASRVNSTGLLIDWMADLTNKPKVFIGASAIGYYGSFKFNQKQNAIKLNENSEAKNDFNHQLCSQIETTIKKAENLNIRTSIARIGVVLGREGGALKKMLPAFKLGLGGKIGSGEQYFSWIEISDLVRALEFLMQTPQCSGIYNLTAPLPVTNQEFTKALGKSIHRPTCLAMPEVVIKILFGEMGEKLLLEGQNVLPERLQANGFSFKYPDINSALKNIFNH